MEVLNYPPNLTFFHKSAKVDMDDDWFDIATRNHFWIRRRWDVILRLIAKNQVCLGHVADIGCGIGTQTALIQDHSPGKVDGFDLNGQALIKAAESYPDCRFFCMNILEGNDQLNEKYDTIFVLDIIEHLIDASTFLRATKKLLKKTGFCIVNVPCGQSLYSAYDKKVGHHRRYSLQLLKKHLNLAGLQLVSWSYWGAPLLPLLIARKIFLLKENKQTIKSGFAVNNSLLNEFLFLITNLEPIPNNFFGSSLTAIAKLK